MYPQGSFRNPYYTYGIGDRGQPARQPSRVSVSVAQQQQQQPPKPTQPARLPSSTKPEEIKKEQDQQKVFTEPKVEKTQPKPKDPSPPLQFVLSETNKDEKMSIVPAGDQGKAMVKGGSGEKSLQLEIKEDMTNLTLRLAELNAQQKLGSQGYQKLQHDLGVRVITLAGENRGATMEVGPGGRNHEKVFGVGVGRKVGEDDKSEEEKGKSRAKGAPASAFVNSNVQAVNNSFLYNSTCAHRDPGVHLALSNSPVKSKEVGGSKEARAKTMKAAKRRGEEV